MEAQNPAIKRLCNNLLPKFGHFRSKEEAIKQERCVFCGKKAFDNIYSEAGKREYHISGSCEKCFDKIFGE